METMHEKHQRIKEVERQYNNGLSLNLGAELFDLLTTTCAKTEARRRAYGFDFTVRASASWKASSMGKTTKINTITNSYPNLIYGS